MAGTFAFLFLYLINTEYGAAASDQMPKRAADSDESPVKPPADPSALDLADAHMFKLYDKYNRELNRPKDGNTVRCFKAHPELVEQKIVYHFNLTSLQESEVILAATLHFLLDKRTRQRSGLCRGLRSPSCRLHPAPSLRLILRAEHPQRPLGPLLGSLNVFPQPRGGRQMKDVTHVVKGARQAHQFLVTAELNFGGKHQRYQEHSSPANLPYLLIYANDLSISEPNSVAASLQRYGPTPAREEPAHSTNSSPDARVKRDTNVQDPIENNELPGVETNPQKYHELWKNTYLALKPKTLRKERLRKGQGNSEGLAKSQILSFDEKTMKKARRRQWIEPRVCSRRYLKVDFADIGWSEWVLAPKSFDAYYCAGTCEFPMSKVVRPSNHATIQSIVRAVGIIHGVPEPCCVPEKMRPLSVLFLDENKNTVLKIYPGMSVETCACR